MESILKEHKSLSSIISDPLNHISLLRMQGLFDSVTMILTVWTGKVLEESPRVKVCCLYLCRAFSLFLSLTLSLVVSGWVLTQFHRRKCVAMLLFHPVTLTHKHSEKRMKCLETQPVLCGISTGRENTAITAEAAGLACSSKQSPEHPATGHQQLHPLWHL